MRISCFAVDESPAEGSTASGQPASQGVVGWAFNTASNTVGVGKSLTEATLRGVGRTAGTAVNTAGGIASRASESRHLPCLVPYKALHETGATLYQSNPGCYRQAHALEVVPCIHSRTCIISAMCSLVLHTCCGVCNLVGLLTLQPRLYQTASNC